MSYEPDHPLDLIFDIESEESYTPLHALNVIIDLDEEDQSGQVSYLTPIGFDSERHGTLSITSSAWTVAPRGFNNSLVPTPLIYNKNQYVKVAGWLSGIFGQTKIHNSQSVVKPSGLSAIRFGTTKLVNGTAVIRAASVNSLQISTPRITFKLRTITTIQANSSAIYGKPFVSHAVRYVEMQNTSALTRFGTSWASYGVRYIEPRGLFQQFASNHNIVTSRSIGVYGFDSARFGTRIIPESQSIYPQGVIGSFGETDVQNLKRHIRPKGFLSVDDYADLRFGRAEFYNLTQILKPYHDEDSRAVGEQFPEIREHTILNRNRYVQMFGFPHQVFGYQELFNTARVISPQGMVSPIEQGSSLSMVAYRIRRLQLVGIESPYITSSHITWLGAKVVSMRGQTQSLFGTPHSENTRRNFRFIGMGEQNIFGRSMISHAIRHVRFLSDYGIHPPVISMPEVKLGKRYIEARGIDSVRYGGQYVVEKFTKIAPKWIVVNRVGEPIVRNVTPSVKIWQFEATLFGNPYVGLYTRTVLLQGLNSQIFGRARISDRKQQIDLREYGITPPLISRTHKIERVGIGQGLPQKIEPLGIPSPVFSIDDRTWHKVTQNVIRPNSENVMSGFGRALVTANTIRVEPGYWETLIGTAVITHLNRSIQMDSSKCDFLELGEPRMSPHTIWAVKEAPQQAIDNHVKPHTQLHYVDGLNTNVTPTREKEPGVEFGTPKISHKHRFLNMRGYLAQQFGLIDIRNVQYIIAPKGFNNLKIGVIAPIGDQKISFRLQAIYSEYGRPSIAHVEKWTGIVNGTGTLFNVIGEPVVDYYHRFLKPSGFDALKTGSRLANDRPYMWQGLRVGVHVPITVGDNDFTQFGVTWISQAVREVVVQGYDFAIVSEYTPGQFGLKMKVYNRNQPAVPMPQLIKAVGFASQQLGVSNIRPKVHYIRPDGNATHYRKGIPNA